MITISPTEYYSRDRSSRRTLLECIQQSLSGTSHWQESFQDPRQLLKLFVDFDVEHPIETYTEETFVAAKEQFLHDLPRSIYAAASGLNLNEHSIALAESCGRKCKKGTDVWSLSAHVVILDYSAQYQHMRGVLEDVGIASIQGFDDAVYKGKRVFRMIGCFKQRKQGEPFDRRRMLPVTYTDPSELHHHIIQDVTNEIVLTPTARPENQGLARLSSQGDTVDVSELHREFLQSNQLEIIQAKQFDGSLSVIVKGFCPFAKKCHHSNNLQVVFQGDTATLKCFSQKCGACKEGSQELLGWSPAPDSAPDLSSVVSSLMNKYLLSKLPMDTSDIVRQEVQNLTHMVTTDRKDGKDMVVITNSAGLCYAAAVGGVLHKHKDAGKVSLVLCKGAGSQAVCSGKHDNVSLRGKDPNEDLKRIKEACGLYGAKKAFRPPTDSTETSMELDYEYSTTQQMVSDAFDIVYGHAQQHGYQKEGGFVVQVNPLCKYDCVPMTDHRGDEMTFEAYYNQVKSQSPKLQSIHAAIPHVRSTLATDMIADDQGRLPYVHRRTELFGFRNGVLSIQSGELGEPFARTEDGTVKHGPDLTFYTHEELEAAGVTGTVRLFYDIEFKTEWMDADTSWSPDAEVTVDQSDCHRFLQTFVDQGFFSDFQDFAVGGRTQKWSVAKLLLALMGRTLFKTGTWDDYAVMYWLYGPSRVGKTLVNFILSHFFQPSSKVQVTSQGRKAFNKEGLVGKTFIWFTDPKHGSDGNFPMAAAELQLLIEGGRNNVSRLHKKDLNNVLIDGALVADSNKKPTQIWQDEDSALLNRMAPIKFPNEVLEKKSSYKSENPKKNPILRHEMGALLCLMVRCYQDLLDHAQDSTFVDWKIPLFETVRDLAARQGDPLYRFLTLPKGEVTTKDAIYWCEYASGAETPVRELKKRFLAWMEFDQKKTVDWDDLDLEQSLGKASKEHEGDMTLKQQSHWYKCLHCGNDVDCNRNKAAALNDCCEAYRDDPKAKSFKAKRTPCNQVKKKEVAKIQGLKLCDEPKVSMTSDMSGWKWNGMCGCGKKARESVSNAGVHYYCCFFGAVDDARCKMRFVKADEIDSERVAVGGHNFP
jgi:hypothetical protein